MITTYKTKTPFEFDIQSRRKKYNEIIYIEVGFPLLQSKVKPQGKYYAMIQNGTKEVNTFDENGDINGTTTKPTYDKVVLDVFRGELDFHTVKVIEDAMLSDFSNVRNIIPTFIERIKQFTLIKIDNEHTEDPTSNWGITSADLEEV